MHSLLRSFFGCALLLSILVGASACDKKEPLPKPPEVSLAGTPRVLFFVFGDKMDARVLPIAKLAEGRVEPISFDSSGWHNFDQLYFSRGNSITLYQDGSVVGIADIGRGMWEGGKPLYKLERCRVLRPIAAVSLSAMKSSPVSVELLAMSAALPSTPQRASTMPADRDSARALAVRVSQREGITNAARAELSEVLNVINTGTTQHPTLVGSYIEQGSGLNGRPRQVFLIGDYADATKSYTQTYVHTPSDSLREFRRFIDHADLTGDGVDEIVLEGWHNRSESYLIIMQYTGGHWRELVRGPTSWCADD